MEDQRPQRVNDGGRPDPDPTLLTTEALFRETRALRESLERQIGSLKELMQEKFRGVEQEFILQEKQRVELKSDTRDAVDSAFAASKEAVKEQNSSNEKAITKSDDATSKVLTQMNATFTTANEATLRSFNELKERIVSVEQRVISIESQRVGAKEDRTGLYATIGVIATLLGIAVVILSRK